MDPILALQVPLVSNHGWSTITCVSILSKNYCTPHIVAGNDLGAYHQLGVGQARLRVHGQLADQPANLPVPELDHGEELQQNRHTSPTGIQQRQK